MENTQMNEQNIKDQLKELPSKTIEQILGQQNIPVENAVQEAEKSGLLYLANRIYLGRNIIAVTTDADGRINSAQEQNKRELFDRTTYIDSSLVCGCYFPGNHMYGQEKVDIMQGILRMGNYFVYANGAICGSDLTKNLMKTSGITKKIDDSSISSWLAETPTEVKVKLYRNFLENNYKVDPKIIDRLHVIPVDMYRCKTK